MIRKLMIIIVFFYIHIYSKSQNMDCLNRQIDTLLIYTNQLINSNLAEDSIFTLERSWIGFGESFVLEIILDKKTTFILTIYGVSDAVTKKFLKQGRLLNSFRKYAFFRYINEHGTLPLDSIDLFKYQFLLLAKKGESFGDALYGEYKFKVIENDISIIDKKIEILYGEDAIKQKYKSNF